MAGGRTGECRNSLAKVKTLSTHTSTVHPHQRVSMSPPQQVLWGLEGSRSGALLARELQQLGPQGRLRMGRGLRAAPTSSRWRCHHRRQPCVEDTHPDPGRPQQRSLQPDNKGFSQGPPPHSACARSAASRAIFTEPSSFHAPVVGSVRTQSFPGLFCIFCLEEATQNTQAKPAMGAGGSALLGQPCFFLELAVVQLPESWKIREDPEPGPDSMSPCPEESLDESAWVTGPSPKPGGRSRSQHSGPHLLAGPPQRRETTAVPSALPITCVHGAAVPAQPPGPPENAASQVPQLTTQ